MQQSTTVEIILYYLTCDGVLAFLKIYNSRNYSILLNVAIPIMPTSIYNSRNYSILLNFTTVITLDKSTTVEIILYYLTDFNNWNYDLSTTVEIILYYLTPNLCICTIF